jgi:hypothetical protein
MTYSEMLEKAKKGNKVKQITSDIKTWESEGDFILGKLIKVEPFSEGEFETEVKKYTFDTDNGIVSTVMGAVADKQIAGDEMLNSVLYITYKGKKKSKKGHMVNKFDMVVIDNA